MVEYEETSSLQVLGTVTADATITVFFGLFSFDGTIHDALFPKGLFTTQLAAAATLLDVLVMLLVRATLAASAVTGTRQCTSRYGLILVFSLHCAMAIWCDTDPTVIIGNPTVWPSHTAELVRRGTRPRCTGRGEGMSITYFVLCCSRFLHPPF